MKRILTITTIKALEIIADICDEIFLILATVWNSTFTTGEKYFVTIEACNEAFLCRILASDGIILDDSPPIQGLVRVGSLSNHQTYIPRKYVILYLNN